MRRKGIIFSSLGVAYFATIVWYRPLPDDKVDADGPVRRLRAGWTSFLSAAGPTDGGARPLLLDLAKRATTIFGVSLMRLFVMGAGDFRIIGEKEYEHFISKVIHRPPNVPLITVSNHRSMMDDPGVLSCILPFWMSIQPRYLKWSLCAQEFCFNSKVKFYATHNVALSPPPLFLSV